MSFLNRKLGGSNETRRSIDWVEILNRENGIEATCKSIRLSEDEEIPYSLKGLKGP